MGHASDVSEALATLQARWGAAAPRRGGEMVLRVDGALARAPLPVEVPDDTGRPEPLSAPLVPATGPRLRTPDPDTDGRVVSTGFGALDAILATGGLPRSATVALRGDASSGKTTVALRVAAEAQAGGGIVAWLDLARAFDPVEAVTRGVRPEWLVVLTPVDLEEALAISAALLAARTVDLLVMDLPDGRDPALSGGRVGDRLGGSQRSPGVRARCSSSWSRPASGAGSPSRSSRRAGCGWSCGARGGSGWDGMSSGSEAR